MRCTAPKFLYFSLDGNGSPVGAPRRPDGSGDYFPMPCSRCVACQLNHARDLAACIDLEARMSMFTCAGTCTFDNEHEQDSFQQVRRIIVNEVKPRMRRAGFNPRSYWLLERGESRGRYHCHPVFFNEDFRDNGIEPMSGTKYQSVSFKKFWPYGIYELDSMSHAAATYCAGHQAGKPLIPKFNEDGSQNWDRIAAARPAIGMAHARKYYSDMNALGALVRGAGLSAIPRKFFKNEPELFAQAIMKRREFAARELDLRESISDLESRDALVRVLLEQGKAVKALKRPKALKRRR